jgi:RTX calcium-binding nonapeptide repeat (4 copies)
MEFQERQFLRLGKRPMAFVAVACLASLMLASAGSAQAKRMLGTRGPDKIVGTTKADAIRSLGGNDRIRGRGGRDRLFGGRGADRVNAVDGRRDRAVGGGPGNDVCRIDLIDRSRMKGCETVKIHRPGRPPGAPGGPGGPGAGVNTCASAPEEARAAQEEAPPTFSAPFYAVTMTIHASVDGVNGDELPISIEEVCDIPAGLEHEAAQLIGGDGVARIGAATQVFDAGGQQLTGAAATTALAGADTVSLKAQLVRPAGWRQDEDGQPVPTFSTSRADITD